jgi:hypothetical protein
MTKHWSEQPLWEKVWLRDDGIHLRAGKIIGHLGCSPSAFFDAAKKLPNYDKWKFECAVRDLTVFSKRDSPDPRYELTAQARKVLRPVIGPHPDADDYVSWWRGRLVSEPDAVPPVPLPELKRTDVPPKRPAKKETRKPSARKPNRRKTG